ncbi:MAG: ArsR family transcriptional regulator [Anaerolineae bacterium]|nr:MAG: ArsR family transcriptional regulator [Anaerolineae bacterium]
MSNPFEELANLDKLLHEPARLSILTALAACESADFTFLRRLTGLSDGNLSIQISKLEEAGLIHVQKQFVAKKPSTHIRITEAGRNAIERYWAQLQELKKKADSWQKTSETE